MGVDAACQHTDTGNKTGQPEDNTSSMQFSNWFGGIGVGSVIVMGNLLLVVVILSQKNLRRKEMLTIAALAFGDLVYGLGIFSSGIRRMSIAKAYESFTLVTPWDCMLEFHNFCFIWGSQAGSIMLVAVSLDRVIAVRCFAYYMNLGMRYAKTVIGGVFMYCTLSLPVIMLLSYFAASQCPSVIKMCWSTNVGPPWFASYQPNVQMWGGILSILLFGLVLYFYKKHNQIHNNDANAKRERKMTKTVGITVLFTLFFFVIPHGLIIILDKIDRDLSNTLNAYAWLISYLNNLSNLFILGIYNTEVRKGLRAMFGLKEASVIPSNQASNKSKKRFLGTGTESAPTNPQNESAPGEIAG